LRQNRPIVSTFLAVPNCSTLTNANPVNGSPKKSK
jgi:hypothetical protein